MAQQRLTASCSAIDSPNLSSLPRRFGVSLASFLVAATAYAGDFATIEPGQAPAKPNCFSSLWSYLDSTPQDCPLSAYGFTVFGVIDAGYGFESAGVPFNRSLLTGVEEIIEKNGNRSLWLLTPNGLSQSTVGIKMDQPIAPGWSVIGDWDFGFDPYTLALANGPGPIAENNLVPLADQNANGDTARAGQWYNGQLFAGIQNATYGSLVGGRVNTLSLDAVSAYDPFGGSYAFSVIGFAGAAAGGGYTENTRYNTAIKYSGRFPGPLGNFHVGGLVQVAGYGAGNGSTNGAQAGAGLDWGGFSGDVVYSWVENAVSASSIPSPDYPLNSLRATLSNNSVVLIAAKYKFERLTISGGYEHINYLPPSRTSANAFYGVGGYYFSDVVTDAYTVNPKSYIGGPKPFNIFWTGFKFAIRDQLDFIGAYYHYLQNDYSGIGCSTNAHPTCAGQYNAFSGAIEWRPVKRLDLYAGVMYSQAIGGLANGYLKTTNVAPTAGLRFRF